MEENVQGGCPKCGIERRSGAAECPKCGIVFAKYESVKPIERKETLCSSRFLRVEQGEFARSLKPMVVAKEYVEALYGKILELIWDELVKGEEPLDNMSNLVAFFIFCVFSLLFYHFRDFDGPILFLLVGLWWADVAAAKRSYRDAAKFDTVTLCRGADKDYVYQRVDWRRRPVYDVDFNGTEIKKVVVRRKAIRAGAFREVMGEVWTAGLQFHNNFELAVFEEKEVTKALLDAQVLSGRFRAPVEFADAARANLAGAGESSQETGLAISFDGSDLSIFTKWSFGNFFQYAMNVLERSGFLLFLLVAQSVMVRFGALVNYFLAPYLGIAPAPLEIELGFGAVWAFFMPEWEIMEILEFMIALGVMVRSGMKLFKRKGVVMNRKSIRYMLGERVVSAMKTPDIRRVLLFEEPELLILILGRKKVMKIENLRNPEEFRAMRKSIEDGLKKLVPAPRLRSRETSPKVS